jgi:hypothetical protein
MPAGAGEQACALLQNFWKNQNCVKEGIVPNTRSDTEKDTE